MRDGVAYTPLFERLVDLRLGKASVGPHHHFFAALLLPLDLGRLSSNSLPDRESSCTRPKA
jgi:hypothetical protein